MGVLTAMNNAVAGIAAQSFAMENISGNIANSSTTAYKRSDTSFSDLVQSDSSNVKNNTSGSVLASSRSTVNIAGDIQSTDVDTNMAINGTGFFQIARSPSDTDQTLYTRRGDFEVDKDGYLVNGSGYYLEGYGINDDGSVSSTLGLIKIDQKSISAQATTAASYNLNLPTSPATTFATNNPDVTDADIYQNDTTRTEADAILLGSTTPGSGYVTAAQEDEFIQNSISGGAITCYDAQGTAVNVQLRWVKTDADSWALFYNSNDTTNDQIWTQVKNGSGNTFAFDSDGTMKTPAAPAVIDFDGTMNDQISVNGVDLGTLSMTLNATQYADTDGTPTINKLSQDGYPKGDFESMSIGEDGTISYSYSNGQVTNEWQVPLVSFSGASYLKALDGGAYQKTVESGSADPYQSGTIKGSALEASNVDISEEFTKLIVTQQAFSANSKVITTADNMVTDILNIIR